MPPNRKLNTQPRQNSIGTREPYSPAPQRPHRAQEDEPGRQRDQLGGEHVERPQVGVDAAHEQVVLPHEEAQQRDAEHPGDGEPVAPQRLAREHRHQLEHDPEAGQRHDVHLGVPEHPEQVLEQVGAAALPGDVEGGLHGAVNRAHQQRRDQHRCRQHHQHAVASTLHTKIGSRDQVIPGARIVMIVTIRLKPSRHIDSPTSAKKPM